MCADAELLLVKTVWLASVQVANGGLGKTLVSGVSLVSDRNEDLID